MVVFIFPLPSCKSPLSIRQAGRRILHDHYCPPNMMLADDWTRTSVRDAGSFLHLSLADGKHCDHRHAGGFEYPGRNRAGGRVGGQKIPFIYILLDLSLTESAAGAAYWWVRLFAGVPTDHLLIGVLLESHSADIVSLGVWHALPCDCDRLIKIDAGRDGASQLDGREEILALAERNGCSAAVVCGQLVGSRGARAGFNGHVVVPSWPGGMRHGKPAWRGLREALREICLHLLPVESRRLPFGNGCGASPITLCIDLGCARRSYRGFAWLLRPGWLDDEVHRRPDRQPFGDCALRLRLGIYLAIAPKAQLE